MTPLGGVAFASRNPARPEEIVWSGVGDVGAVPRAVARARAAQPRWHALGMDGRAAVLRTFQRLVKEHERALAEMILREVGKVSWDALAEAQLLAAKVDVTLDPAGALARVAEQRFALSPTRQGRCVFRPHGVMAVVGPFNFPMHLPNGHIVPALALGNTVVFKPSDKAPACGEMLAGLYRQALRAHDAPEDAVVLVQGGAEVARGLVDRESDIDGVLFTGSWPVGRAIAQANLDRPGRILALEMGGNNAAVVMDDADLPQAVVECVRSAFIGGGQRCTCTRRVIVHETIAGRFIPALCKAARALVVGEPDAQHPVFMGPLIAQSARDAVLDAQRRAAAAGGTVLVESTAPQLPGGGWYATPGVVRVEGFTLDEDLTLHAGADVEVFGPLLRVCVVDSFDAAVAQANTTRFGLAASIFTRDERSVERFLAQAKAGCINVNTGTAGASGKLPFGGLGLSGNHRPAGAFSVDYCAYPVASMVETGSAGQTHPGMTFDPRWV